MGEKMMAVTTTGTHALAAYEYGADVGAGYEGQTAADTSIPFLSIAEALSAAVDEGRAVPGQIVNSVTGNIADAVMIVPCRTDHVYIEWRPRAEGGGYLGRHAPSSAIVAAALAASTEFGRYMTTGGSELQESFEVYCVVVDPAGEPAGFAVLSFTGARIRVYRHWMTRLRSFLVPTLAGRRPAPLFAHLTRLSTEKVKAPKGTYHIPRLEPARGSLADSLIAPDSALYVAARDLRSLIEQGKAAAAPPVSPDEIPF